MTTALITGANKGLGYETARRLQATGYTVFIRARDPDRGADAAAKLGARFVQLDVTDEASVKACGRDGTSTGRSPASSVRSAMRVARFPDLTATKVAAASTSVPTAVPASAISVQSSTLS